jgi:lysozyme
MKREMKASRILIDKVKEFEGLRLKAYYDSAGVATIGYGHTRGVKMGQCITEAEAEQMLEQDLWEAGRFANTIPELNTQGRYDAVVDFIFNLGVGNFKRSTLYKYILRHAPDKLIQAEFRRWVHSGGKVLQGLVKRREWEAQRWAE